MSNRKERKEKSLLVMKFGGAALKTTEHIKDAAQTIIEKKRQYSQIVVVVSAMGSMTDKLIDLACCISKNPPRREQDMLVSVGERISMALLAMALKEKQQEAVSLTGSQSGIITCNRHTEARIKMVKPQRIFEQIYQNKIVIVAGFQGVSREREITTLGRGGSDTSAVALAIALDADKVEFYKDVLGVYAEDPRKSKEAKLFSSLSYEDALRLAEGKEFVLHKRAILLASKNSVPLHIVNFDRKQRQGFPGTLVGSLHPFLGGKGHYEVDDEEK